MSFVNSLDPVLASLGPFQIRYYGLVYTFGFLAAYILLRSFAKKGLIKNLDADKADSLLIWLILGLVAGARIFAFAFYQPQAFLTNPFEIFYIWHGGMSFHGALVGSFIAVYLFCRKHNIRFYQVADLLSMPAAAFLFLGRIANFVNSELVGTVTTPERTPWCVVYEKVDSYCRHPSQLYEAAKNLFIFFVLLGMNASKKFREGIIFWTFILLYGTLRFIENFWRDDPRMLGLSMGQYLSLFMIPIAVYFLIKISSGKTTQNKN